MEQDLSLAVTHLGRISGALAANLLDSRTMTIAQDGVLRVAYAPFDYIARNAKVVIVGITPGRVQATNALSAAQSALEKGKSVPESLAEAKLTGSFSGPLRANLVAMLDSVGVAEHLGVQTTADIFRPGSQDVHFTSALRYPVFVDGKNYNGTPDLLKTPLLRKMVETHLAEEAQMLPDALWLPLGPRPEAALRHLAGQGLLDRKRILSGLPHPSGANAERIAVFLGRKSPELASRQTNPAKLLSAFNAIVAQIAALKGASA
ncbi:hypothetical protein ACFSUD_16465 [Sulfitobacter aestuarii]|uniref:Uracil DNA glycosylase superfamily protein n=1 Tax=Sulfitobacter aestuarii TaxID=2161676 RepID=A0ABW5U8M3_9RHOB